MSAGFSAFERIALLALAGLIAVCWMCAFFARVSFADPDTAEYLWLAIFCSLTVLFVAIVRLLVARDMLRTYWDISDTMVEKKTPTRIVSVEFGRIRRFRFNRVPGLFGFGTITHQGGTLFLSFFIQNLHGLIKDIRDGVDRSGQSGAYQASNLDEFDRKVRKVEARNDRLKRFMPALFFAMMMILVVAVVTSLFLWHFPVLLTFLWALVVLIFFLSSVLGAEVALALWRVRPAGQPGPFREAEIYLLAGIAGLVLCLCCGILLTSAFPL